MQQRQQGFTLIEIAIVLVIIGVLLGGILKGQEMLTQGKIRAIEKELDGVAVAILGYRDRYKALPGDDSLALARWEKAKDGGANGVIDGSFDSTTVEAESFAAWQHLRFAGLIGGDALTGKLPINAAGGITGIQTNVSGSTNTLNGTVVCTTKLSAKIANGIDSQQDDGLPDKGSIRGYEIDISGTTDFTKAITAYKDDGNQQYTICRSV